MLLQFADSKMQEKASSVGVETTCRRACTLVRDLRTASRCGRWRHWLPAGRRCGAGGPLEDREGQCPHQRHAGVEPEGQRIAVVMVIPPPQKHWGAQHAREVGELDVTLEPTECLAPEILADHGPVGRCAGVADGE